MLTDSNRLYRGHRFPPEVISHAVWLYFRFPLSLRMVEEMLAARGICVTYETVRQWGKKFGKAFADQIRQRAPRRQMAYGRSRGLDRRRDALAVARRRSEWLRSRRPGPAPTGCEGCATAHDACPEIRRDAAARDDYGQASILWSRESEDGPSDRASPAQEVEQSGPRTLTSRQGAGSGS
jgi:putative transposase